MTLRAFIRVHRSELDSYISKKLNGCDFSHNDEERRLWILNDEGLYRWAKSEGVRI